MQSTQNLLDYSQITAALSNTNPSTTTPSYVSLKGYSHVTVIITQKAGTGPTGSAITCKQASAIAGTGEKALAFDKYRYIANTAVTYTYTNAAVSSNTFTTNTVADKNSIYVFDVNAEDLDVTNSFDCFRVGTADATNSTLTVTYILGGARYPQASGSISAQVD